MPSRRAARSLVVVAGECAHVGRKGRMGSASFCSGLQRFGAFLPNLRTRYDVLEQVGNALIGNIPGRRNEATGHSACPSVQARFIPAALRFI